MSTASLRVVGHECHAPLQIKKFYISTDGTHTPAPQQRGRWWKGNVSEMGTQEKKKKKKTPTPTHLAQSGQTGQGKRKSGRTTGQTPTRGEGGADWSSWHNLQGESQTYLGTRRAQTWPNTGARMRKGTNGDLVNDKWCIHKCAQESWKGPRPSVIRSTL